MYRPRCCAVAARTAGATVKYPGMPPGVSYRLRSGLVPRLIGRAGKRELWLGVLGALVIDTSRD